MNAPKQQLLLEISNASARGYSFYVYSLSDGEGVFYVGKGSGDRVLHHQRLPESDKNTAKKARIRSAGNALEHCITAYFKHEDDAYRHEASLISELPCLTNIALGDYVAPIDRARMHAQTILDRIVPFEQWKPGEYFEAFKKVTGCTSERDFYDRMVKELQDEIRQPSPTSIEFDKSGRIVRVGYNESHGKPWRPHRTRAV